jgi:hypothetical protein
MSANVVREQDGEMYLQSLHINGFCLDSQARHLRQNLVLDSRQVSLHAGHQLDAAQHAGASRTDVLQPGLDVTSVFKQIKDGEEKRLVAVDCIMEIQSASLPDKNLEYYLHIGRVS